MLYDVPCNICSRHEVDVLFETGVAQVHRIVRCKHCNLLYSNPRSLGPELQDEAEDESSPERQEYLEQRLDKERNQVEDFTITRQLLNSLYPQRGHMLEIGCGYGYLLARFREDGWKVSGCDPWKAACDFTMATHGIDAKPTILEKAGIPDQTIDVVIMNHVIEHMPDPLTSLREIHRVLKPGGHLVIETPRYDTLMFKLFGKRERSMSCDQHIYFFTTETLEQLHNLAGFHRVKLWYTGRTVSLERLLWNIGVMSKSEPVKNCLKAVARACRLGKMRVHINTRDMQRVCVQKA